MRQAVALLPWGHILRLIRKVGNDDAMLFYAQKTIAVLLGQRIFPVGMMGKALTHIRHIE